MSSKAYKAIIIIAAICACLICLHQYGCSSATAPAPMPELPPGIPLEQSLRSDEEINRFGKAVTWIYQYGWPFGYFERDTLCVDFDIGDPFLLPTPEDEPDRMNINGARFCVCRDGIQLSLYLQTAWLRHWVTTVPDDGRWVFDGADVYIVEPLPPDTTAARMERARRAIPANLE